MASVVILFNLSIKSLNTKYVLRPHDDRIACAQFGVHMAEQRARKWRKKRNGKQNKTQTLILAERRHDLDSVPRKIEFLKWQNRMVGRC